MDSPEASWRCTWLSVVRAPIAPQRDRVGDVLRAEFGSRNSQPDGQAEVDDVQQQPARGAQPAVHVVAAVQARVVDQALPADRGPRLLEVHPHHHAQLVGEVGGGRRPGGPRSRARPRTSWTEHGPTTTSSRSSSPARTRRTASRERCTTAAWASPSGSSASSSSGAINGWNACNVQVAGAGRTSTAVPSGGQPQGPRPAALTTKGRDVSLCLAGSGWSVSQRASPPAPPRASLKRQYQRVMASDHTCSGRVTAKRT